MLRKHNEILEVVQGDLYAAFPVLSYAPRLDTARINALNYRLAPMNSTTSIWVMPPVIAAGRG